MGWARTRGLQAPSLRAHSGGFSLRPLSLGALSTLKPRGPQLSSASLVGELGGVGPDCSGERERATSRRCLSSPHVGPVALTAFPTCPSPHPTHSAHLAKPAILSALKGLLDPPIFFYPLFDLRGGSRGAPGSPPEFSTSRGRHETNKSMNTSRTSFTASRDLRCPQIPESRLCRHRKVRRRVYFRLVGGGDGRGQGKEGARAGVRPGPGPGQASVAPESVTPSPKGCGFKENQRSGPQEGCGSPVGIPGRKSHEQR